MRNHTFIVAWEGTDGSGKTTLMRRVAQILVGRGFRVGTHKTPGAMRSGKFAVSYGNSPKISPLSRMLLFLANTVDETSAMMRKIERRKLHFLFIDRYYLCSTVYGLALIKRRRGLEDLPSITEALDLLERLGKADYLSPDVYVIVDVGEEERLKRLRGKRGREKLLETDTVFQNMVREIYGEFSASRPEKVVKILNETGKLEELAASTAERLVELRDKTVSAGAEPRKH
ncbi:MAG: dTMP kinase [Nitrososphaerota archaeon]|nr:thymidylate kinase [Candidatus Calditenuaceae archaeon]MDW8073653.1 dTMP kinase [Nitrososphaerota archaeon]